jgi:hypothetical protein
MDAVVAVKFIFPGMLAPRAQPVPIQIRHIAQRSSVMVGNTPTLRTSIATMVIAKDTLRAVGVVAQTVTEIRQSCRPGPKEALVGLPWAGVTDGLLTGGPILGHVHPYHSGWCPRTEWESRASWSLP